MSEIKSLAQSIADDPYALTPDQWASEARQAIDLDAQPPTEPRAGDHVHDYDAETGSCYCGDVWDESKDDPIAIAAKVTVERFEQMIADTTNPRAHTATPWRVCEFPHSASDVPWSIKDVDGVVILDCRTEELAEQIVNDHNQHTKLVAALRLMVESYVQPHDNGIAAQKARAALANEPEGE